MKRLSFFLIASIVICQLSFAQEYWTWAQSNGGTDIDNGNEITIDQFGDMYIVGSFISDTIIEGEDTLLNNGNYDVFVVKKDSDGATLWAHSFGGGSVDHGRGIVTDAQGNVYVTGYFGGSVTFGDNVLTSDGDSDMFLVKYDGNGTPLWAVRGGNSGLDISYGITIDNLDNIYVSGYFKGANTTFDQEVVTNKSASTEDIFVVRYDTDGNVIWARSAGSSNRDLCFDVAADNFGNIYVTGWFYAASLSFASDVLTTTGWSEFYLLKYDSAGNEKWARGASSSREDEGFGVATDSDGNVYATGNFVGSTLIVDAVTLTNNGDRDMFICKYDSLGEFKWARNTGGALQDRGEDIAIDTSGDVIVAGWYQSADMMFASELMEHNSGSDGFLIKYDSDGNEIWGQGISGSADDISNNLAIDNSNNIYVGGYTSSLDMILGNYTTESNGMNDYFVGKLSECALTVILADTVFWCDPSLPILDAGAGNNLAYIWSTDETTQSILAYNSGLYWVEITDANGCVANDTTDLMVNICVEVESNLVTGKLIIYPNPCNSILKVELLDKNLNEGSLEIIDINGRILYNKEHKYPIQHIDISDYSKGVYFIQILSEEYNLKKRFIVN